VPPRRAPGARTQLGPPRADALLGGRMRADSRGEAAAAEGGGRVRYIYYKYNYRQQQLQRGVGRCWQQLSAISQQLFARTYL
jgi:hypothetical protein